MNMDKKTYEKFAKAHAKRSPTLKNCALAFLFGGIICTIGQSLRLLYTSCLGMEDADAGTLVSISLIFLAALLTALGVFDRIAKHAGGGTLVPITGFANSVVSPAIDSKSEGFILGVGAKIFTVAGPVILYGTTASVVYGIVYYVCKMI